MKIHSCGFSHNVGWLITFRVLQGLGAVIMQALAKELFFSRLSEADRSRYDVRDSMRNDCFGIAQDLRLRCMEWGFSLSDVSAHVYMQHSRVDDQVPFVTAEMTSRLLPNCRFEARESGEHFSRQVLDDFIARAMIAHYKREGKGACGP